MKLLEKECPHCGVGCSMMRPADLWLAAALVAAAVVALADFCGIIP